MAIDFPMSPPPANGQIFTAPGGTVWSWNGTAWVVGAGSSGAYLPLVGGTLSGPLYIASSGDPGQSTASAGFSAKIWRLAINTGDDGAAASITYRVYDTNALCIVGAGASPNRLVHLWDNVTVDSTLQVNGTCTINNYTTVNDFKSNNNVWVPNGFGSFGNYLYTASYIQAGSTISAGGSVTGKDVWCARRDGSVDGCLYITSGGMRIYYNNLDRMIFWSNGDVQVTSGGTLYVRNGSSGYVQLYSGDSSNAGYIRFFHQDGTSRGYIGSGNDGLNIAGENSSRINLYASNIYPGGYMFCQDVRPNSNNNWSVGVSGQAWSQVATYWLNNVSGRAEKRDIETPEPGALAQVMALAPRQYRWRENWDEETRSHIEPDERLHRGFIADEVLAVMGGKFAGYHRSKDGHEGIAYNELTAVLWQAVQELAAEVAELKRQK